MDELDDDGFAFVLHRPNEKLSQETRSKIRRHSMKAVAAARNRSNGGAFNYYRMRKRREAPPSPLPPIPLSGLELLVRDRGIDPMDLSALTSVHMGTIASAMLQATPSQLSDVLLCRQWSYFSFIPPRFGHVPALDDAFRCLLIMAHSMLVPSYKPSNNIILASYGKALRSLQDAVNEPHYQCIAEVVCAAGMLALCELLHSTDGQLWCHHIDGAARLIQFNGPEAYTSEFEKALLMALSYPICAESLLNNQKCFLEDPQWTRALKNATVQDEMFTDRSPLGIALLILMTKIPTLAKRTGHAVTVQDTLQEDDFDTIAIDVRALRTAVVSWRRDFNTALIHVADEQASRYELLGVALIIHILANRMLLCLVPGERGLLEEEVGSLALELRGLQGTVGRNHRAGFFLSQKAKIADAALATHVDFMGAVGSGRNWICRWHTLKLPHPVAFERRYPEDTALDKHLQLWAIVVNVLNTG
ncbi:hypothetical protein GQ53DRAFT_791642 [Thozetella sp. PMI_491]|nr:hypothetical protein GQ53DRAFT_791642 [Thozetella sp. PMI_491]